MAAVASRAQVRVALFGLAAVQGGAAAGARVALDRLDQPAGGAALQSAAPGAEPGPSGRREGARGPAGGLPHGPGIQRRHGQRRHEDEPAQGVQRRPRRHRGHPGELGIGHEDAQQEHLHHAPVAELLQDAEGAGGPGALAPARDLLEHQDHAAQVEQRAQDHGGEQDGRQPGPAQAGHDPGAARDRGFAHGAVHAQHHQGEPVGQEEQDERGEVEGQREGEPRGTAPVQHRAAARAEAHGAPPRRRGPMQEVAVGTGQHDGGVCHAKHQGH